MKHTHAILRTRLLHQAGLFERPPARFHGWSYEQLHAQECGDVFCTLMDNRLVMGVMRYGLMRREVPPFQDLEKALKRAASYRKTGNRELLVDAANYLRAEFNRSQHPNSHFHAIDDRHE